MRRARTEPAPIEPSSMIAAIASDAGGLGVRISPTPVQPGVSASVVAASRRISSPLPSMTR
jgi:hypothetical protein